MYNKKTTRRTSNASTKQKKHRKRKPKDRKKGL